MPEPQFTNRLKDETSPYLIQHASNPVDWYPWGPEALAKAKSENKPIFLSIGYSACHWCHVMAHESFENEKTARLMNELFINIKLDREERPDIDAVYMKAIVALTGHGGWPMSVFLTPDQKPYFGGTYYPPEPKFNRPGFPQILQEAHDLFVSENNQATTRADNLLDKIENPLPVPDARGVPAHDLIDAAVAVMAERYDENHGGFGAGMKFPESMVYSLMLRHWLRTESDSSIQMVDRSLTRMAEGGMYDQIGGGFHRYSTDREWNVPHFEKMLYDNALLARLYLETFQATKQDIYERIPREIFEYIEREMTSPEGAFYSSQDADTEEGEGWFFTWELKEVLDILGPRHAKVFARAYGITPRGNFEKRNVLKLTQSAEQISNEEGIPIFEVDHIIKKSKATLFEVREKRESPGRDEKILTGWNGMMISAIAFGHSVLGDKTYLERAEKCANFLWQTMWQESTLLRVFNKGEARIAGCLEDYAWLLEGFLTLYEAAHDPEWITRSMQLADSLIENFWDEKEGGFFITDKREDVLVTRLKNPADEAVPSANAIASRALLRLGALTGQNKYADKGRATIDAFRDQVEHRAGAYTALLSAMDFEATASAEIVLSGPKDDPVFEELRDAVFRDYRPNKVVLGYAGEKNESLLPLTQSRGPVQGKPTVYLCQKQTCYPPVHTAVDLLQKLDRPPIIRLNIFDEDKAYKDMEKNEQEQFMNAMSQMFKFSGLGKKP